MNNSTKTAFLFLSGLFCATQVQIVGSIGITELVCYLLAPFILLQDMNKLRRQGFMPAIWLLIATIVNCIISSYCNNTYYLNALKGIASPYAFLATIVVFGKLLDKNFDNLKWFWVGVALSYVVNIFVFQPGTSTRGGMRDTAEAMEAIIGYQLFWFVRLSNFIHIPTFGWYLKTPIAFSYIAPVILGLWVALTTETGRSALITVFAGSGLIFICRKSSSKMVAVSRHFVSFVILACVLLFAVKTAYVEFASRGLMGEGAQDKYEKQIGGKKDFLSILMGGRGEFFIGGFACLRKPITGWGPWAVDTEGIIQDFLLKYGNEEDYKRHLAKLQVLSGRLPGIPGHSHLIGWWLWMGIFGLIFWIYVTFLIFNFFRKWVGVYPPWFGLFAIMLPAFAWDIFFSPVGTRVEHAMVIVCLLYVKGIYERRIANPWDYADPRIKMKYR